MPFTPNHPPAHQAVDGAERVLTLADLVGDVDRFAAECWGLTTHRHTLVRPDRLRDLIDVDAVDVMLDGMLRAPLVRVARAGARIGEAEYTRRVRIAGRELTDVADPDVVRQRFAAGETIVLQGLHRTWPPLRRTALGLEAELDHPVQVNAYVSPPAAAGLPRHADVHDVFVVQVDGCKRWDVAGHGPLTMAPGDVLYLPRGTEHAATTGETHSLHLTIGVPATTHRDVMRRVIDRLDDPRLDQRLPIGFTRQRGDELRDALAGSVVAVIDAAGDGDEILDREVARVLRRRRPGGRSLAMVVASSSVTEHSVLARRRDVAAVLDPSADEQGRCVLRCGSTTLRMPEHVRPALRRVLTGDVVRASDLDTLTASGAVVLLRRLVREGVLAVR